MSASSTTPEGSKPPAKTNNICQVCGDNASIVNYGVLTCASCRTFFRRNGFNTKEIAVCRFDGRCEIVKTTRKYCTACRLAKCLNVGMNPDLIRKEELTKIKRKPPATNFQESTEHITTTTVPQTSALDLVTHDSLLTSTDLLTISNIVHAFDTFSPVADIRRTIDTLHSSASNSQFDSQQTIQMLSSFSNCLLLFLSSTPDFKVLTTSEQRSLLQRNMFGLLSLGGMYLMRESGIFDTPENEMIVALLYDNDTIRQARLISKRLDDPILIKLMLVALAFSSNCLTQANHRNFDRDSLLHGTFRLFGSQNVYVELLWKYLNHQHDDYQAVQRFSKLIKLFLDTFKFSCEVYETNELYKKFIDIVTEEAEKSSVINDQTVIPLWGKN
ncbi:unnamed protein product [Adineta ricciae]|uniref:Nuclear receptor domain-containing protein n=1 Tax=Adineta ricciae TaxID=249248 RepID=A0A814PYD5_ADIRI|nr:unnamed protein product [Adineta ricciae]